MLRPIITVFGGSGFIGRHLVPRLAADGWLIRVAVRDPEAALFLKPMGEAGQVVPLRADISDPSSVAAVLRGAHAAVNLVGILYERGKATFQRVHVEGAANLALGCRDMGVSRLVHVSAIGADERSDSAYAKTKAMGEREAKKAFADVTIVRPSVIFGPEDDFFNRFAQMARLSPILPVFNTRMQPVFVGDVAEGITRAVSRDTTKGMTFEFGGPRILSFRSIMELVVRETGRRRKLVQMPLRAAAMQALFLERLPTPPLTRDQVKLLARDNIVGSGLPTLKDLGITPTAVEAVVPLYLRRYRRRP